MAGWEWPLLIGAVVGTLLGWLICCHRRLVRIMPAAGLNTMRTVGCGAPAAGPNIRIDGHAAGGDVPTLVRRGSADGLPGVEPPLPDRRPFPPGGPGGGPGHQQLADVSPSPELTSAGVQPAT